MFQLVEQTTQEKATSVFGALPKVCLIVSQSHRVSEIDFESAQNQLHGSLKQFPDLYFVFLSNDINTFKEMALQMNSVGILDIFVPSDFVFDELWDQEDYKLELAAVLPTCNIFEVLVHAGG